MMQWRLKTLISMYEEQTPGNRLSYRQIEEETGISKTVLTRIATNRASRAELNTIQMLLSYFSGKLGRKLTTNDILWYV